MIIFIQAAEIVADFIKFTDKKQLTNIYINGGYVLLRSERDKPSPTEDADTSHTILMRSMMIKNHFDIIQSINENCLEFFYKQKDETLDNLVADWSKIVSILS